MRIHDGRSIIRGFAAVALASFAAAAPGCPLCLGAGQPTVAQQLRDAAQAVLAAPTAEAGRFRAVAVLKGARPEPGMVEAGYPRTGPATDATPKPGKPLLLVRDDPFPTWTILGAIGADHAGWLRKLAAARPVGQMNANEWRERIALVAGYLEHPDPLVAQIAYGELAAAPYAAMREARPRVDAAALRRWLADPALAARQPLYLLLLGVAGNARDAAALEQRLDAAARSGDAANLGPLLAADLELRGSARLAWVEANYLRDRARSTREIEAVLLALSVHGNADGTFARERVIEAYRVFMKTRPEIAGYVAQDLAAWRYWDAVPEYDALMKSDVPQQYPSRIAIAAYLRQSQAAQAREPHTR
jgi:hypothetical protein